jgi:hypothetical protein
LWHGDADAETLRFVVARQHAVAIGSRIVTEDVAQ